MNVRNKRLCWHFWNTAAYNRPSENREVTITYDANNVAQYVYALLHNNAIARRCLNTGVVEVCTAGWPTRTTANAIRACLPPGWNLSCWTLTSPKGGYLNLAGRGGWVPVIDPLEAYKAKNGW